MHPFVKRFKRQIRLMEKFSKLDDIVKYSPPLDNELIPGPLVCTFGQYRPMYYTRKGTLGKVRYCGISKEPIMYIW